MSYRNPQIIVDRSAEIWAQGVAKVGDVLNRGIEAYATAKRKSEDAKRKRDEAKNRFLVNAEIEQDKNIVKAVGEIKDTKVRDVFSKIFTEKGDAAIKAQTELAMNTNLPPNIRKEYRKTISDFQSYMLNSKDQINNVMGNAQSFDERTIDQIVADEAPSSGDELSNLLAVMAVNGKKSPGVESSIDISADGNNSNRFKVNSRIKVGSQIYNKFKDSGMLDGYEESDGFVNVSFDRDLSAWDGSFFEPIPAESDRNKNLQESNIFDDKNKLTKDFVYQNVTTRVVGGFEYTEQVVNNAAMEDNVAYRDLIKSNAKGIMSYPIKQQKQFITGRLKWDKETADAYENSPVEEREEFLIGQMMDRNLKSLGTERKATAEDVNNLGIPNLKVGDPIYTNNVGKPKAVKVEEQEEEEETDFKMNAAERAVGDLLEDPISYLTNIGGPDASGVADRNYDEETKILEFSMTDKGTGSKKMKKFDLSDKSQVKNLARTLFNFRGNKSLEVSENIDSVVDKIFDFSETGDLPIF
eukprot:SAG22_NODE_466_length_10173_cov_47.267421_2_plen_525_part_00